MNNLDSSQTSLDRQRELIRKWFLPASIVIFLFMIISAIYYSKSEITNSTKNTLNSENNMIKGAQVGDQSFTNAVTQQQNKNPELAIINNTPYTSNDFKITYSFKDDTFIVTLVGSNKQQSEQEANAWFEKFGVPLNKLKIYYY